MSAPLVEKGVVPGEDYLSGFFKDISSDFRFSKTEYEQISPHTAIDVNSRQIVFVLVQKFFLHYTCLLK